MNYKNLIVWFVFLLVLAFLSFYIFKTIYNLSMDSSYLLQHTSGLKTNIEKIKNEIKENSNIDSNIIVGGDKDIHGCIGSAGYSYCVVLDKCIRPWEDKCEKTETSKIVLDPNNKKISCEKNGGIYYEETKVCEINSFSESTCLARGGEFNPCASACRNDPKAEICTLQCVLTCSFK